MRILFVSSEVTPFAKTGGLADVSGALPKALKKVGGHDIRVFMPRYKRVIPGKFGLKPATKDVSETTLPDSDVRVYCLEHENYFGSRNELYSIGGKDYDDNLKRFALFCQSAVNFPKIIGWKPDVVHCNDWQSALAIAYVKVLHRDDPFYRAIATVYSTHNLAYTGLFPREMIHQTGFGWEQFTPEKLEYWGNIALAKAGFVYADIITTVSETYAEEMQTYKCGCGLEGLIRSRRQDLFGILNGIDNDYWDPATDPNITANYSASSLLLKAENKMALQRANGLKVDKNIPVIGIVSRLCDQKGLDIVTDKIEELMRLKLQLVILGNGDLRYHELLEWAKMRYPWQIGLNLKFDEKVAHQIYAGADMFLMPSFYEPCGLSQLISFRYGTVPIVRKTGGLADTVHNFDLEKGSGDGFVFEQYSSSALLEAVKRAISVYGTGKAWEEIQKRIMAYDYSWDTSARKYESIYLKAISKATSAH